MSKLVHICFDLDGTLLNDEKKINDSVRKMLYELSNKYIYILCSGRHQSEMLSYADEIGMIEKKRGYIISCDGQYVYDLCNEEQIGFEFLDFHDVTLFDRLFENDRLMLCTSKSDFLTVKKKNMESHIRNAVNKLRHRRCRIVTLDELKEETGSQIEKIIVNNVTKENAYKLIADGKVEEKYNYHFINGNAFEIKHKAVNKWNALKLVMDKEKISKEELVYFGDDENDMKCFQNIETTFAMGNAATTIKELAKYVVGDNNHEGIKEGMRIVRNNNG